MGRDLRLVRYPFYSNANKLHSCLIQNPVFVGARIYPARTIKEKYRFLKCFQCDFLVSSWVRGKAVTKNEAHQINEAPRKYGLTLPDWHSVHITTDADERCEDPTDLTVITYLQPEISSGLNSAPDQNRFSAPCDFAEFCRTDTGSSP